MKHLLRFIGATLVVMLAMVACTSKTDVKGIQIEGVATDVAGDSLYLYDVLSEYYGYVKPIASFPIVEGKFAYSNDTIAAQLYYISPNGQQMPGDLDKNGAFVFLANGKNKMTVVQTAPGVLTAEIADSPIAAQYKSYKDKEYELGNQAMIDSINTKFFEARDAGDTLEMARLRDASEPYYNEGSKKVSAWLKEIKANNKHELFDLYLFYSNEFQHTVYNSIEEINAVREEIKLYNAEAQASAYPALIEKSLAQQELSAIGVVAPEVTGEAPDGSPIKLSDFRGKYVLMDFWASGCSWCRAETPNLIKVYEEFKDKDFTILGISSDYSKEDWLGAIEEDGSHWDHLLLGKDGRKISSDYSIIGIPLFVLVDKEGKILAKGMRGEEIYTTVAKYLGE